MIQFPSKKHGKDILKFQYHDQNIATKKLKIPIQSILENQANCENKITCP